MENVKLPKKYKKQIQKYKKQIQKYKKIQKKIQNNAGFM